MDRKIALAAVTGSSLDTMPQARPAGILCLAGLLSNGVRIDEGSRFPCGWDTSGNRTYIVATPGMLRDARRSVRLQDAGDVTDAALPS